MVGELDVGVDRAGEEAFAERAIRHEPDAELLERREHLLLGSLPPQRVLALHGSHRKHGVGPADRAGRRFGQAPVLDLAGVDEFLDRSGDLFNGNVRIDTMLVVEIDRVDAEPTQRAFGSRPDGVGSATGRLTAGIDDDRTWWR